MTADPGLPVARDPSTHVVSTRNMLYVYGPTDSRLIRFHWALALDLPLHM